MRERNGSKMTQRQNECACANSFPPFSRAGASRETGFNRNHSGKMEAVTKQIRFLP